MKLLKYLIASLFLSTFVLTAALLPAQLTLEEETRLIEEYSKEIAKLYELPEGVDLLEITDRILSNPKVKDERKESIRAYGRRTFLFTYPSDGLQVKGIISFVHQPQGNPTLIFLRGGNRTFGMLSPGSDFATHENYTVVASTYRDGVSQGRDEFGGGDVNDVKNMIDYLPILEQKLSIEIQKEGMYMIGSSRGGMQMFLALSRHPELQERFSKIVSLSGLLDIRLNIQKRADMREMFSEDFGYIEGVNDEEWLALRDPIAAAENISPRLPILILQGTEDLRVSLDEGYHMVEKLESLGAQVSYLEVDGGDHCLTNQQDKMALIFSWLAA